MKEDGVSKVKQEVKGRWEMFPSPPGSSTVKVLDLAADGGYLGALKLPINHRGSDIIG